MKIEYKFADGTVTEISTDETHGVVTIGGRRLEDGRAGGICMEEAQRLAEVAGNLCSLADRLQAAVDAAVAARASREGVSTLEEVRAALAEKANAGYAAGVKRLVVAHGAGRLSEVALAEYPVLLAEAEEL